MTAGGFQPEAGTASSSKGGCPQLPPARGALIETEAIFSSQKFPPTDRLDPSCCLPGIIRSICYRNAQLLEAVMMFRCHLQEIESKHLGSK